MTVSLLASSIRTTVYSRLLRTRVQHAFQRPKPLISCASTSLQRRHASSKLPTEGVDEMIAELHKAVEENEVPVSEHRPLSWSPPMANFMQAIHTATPQGPTVLRTTINLHLSPQLRDDRASLLNQAVAALLDERKFDIAALVFELGLSKYGHVFPADATAAMLAISHAVATSGTEEGHDELISLLEGFFLPSVRKHTASDWKPAHPGSSNYGLPAIGQGSLADLLDLMDAIDYPADVLEGVALLYYELNPGIVPSAKMATKMINFAGRGGDIDAAVSWLTRAQSTPTSRGGNKKEASKGSGRRKGVYSTEIHLSIEDISQVVGESFPGSGDMRSQGMLARPYAAIINKLFRKKKVSANSLKDLLRHMARAGITPDTGTFNALIGFYLDQWDFETAIKLYDALVMASGLTLTATTEESQTKHEETTPPNLPIMLPNANTFKMMNSTVHLITAKMRQEPPYPLNPQPPASCAPRLLFKHMMHAHSLRLAANPSISKAPISSIQDTLVSTDSLNFALSTFLRTRDYAGALVCLRSSSYFSLPQAEVKPTLATLRAIVYHVFYRIRSWRSRIDGLSPTKRHTRVHARTWEGEMVGHNLARARSSKLVQVARAVFDLGNGKAGDGRRSTEVQEDKELEVSEEPQPTTLESSEPQPDVELPEADKNWSLVPFVNWRLRQTKAIRRLQADTIRRRRFKDFTSSLGHSASLPVGQLEAILRQALQSSMKLDESPISHRSQKAQPESWVSPHSVETAIRAAAEEMIPSHLLAKLEWKQKVSEERSQEHEMRGELSEDLIPESVELGAGVDEVISSVGSNEGNHQQHHPDASGTPSVLEAASA